MTLSHHTEECLAGNNRRFGTRVRRFFRLLTRRKLYSTAVLCFQTATDNRRGAVYSRLLAVGRGGWIILLHGSDYCQLHYAGVQVRSFVHSFAVLLLVYYF